MLTWKNVYTREKKKQQQQQLSRVYFIVTESEIVPNNELNFYKFRIFSLMVSKYCIRLGATSERNTKEKRLETQILVHTHTRSILNAKLL